MFLVKTGGGNGGGSGGTTNDDTGPVSLGPNVFSAEQELDSFFKIY